MGDSQRQLQSTLLVETLQKATTTELAGSSMEGKQGAAPPSGSSKPERGGKGKRARKTRGKKYSMLQAGSQRQPKAAKATTTKPAGSSVDGGQGVAPPSDSSKPEGGGKPKRARKTRGKK